MPDNASSVHQAADSWKHSWIPVGAIRLHSVEEGQGSPVVLLPGWPQSWYAWRHVMTLLAQSGRRAIVFDPPGLGDSDLLANGGAYDTGDVADLIHTAVQLLRLGQTDLVGHDAGTWIAFAYASRHPASVRCLVLLEAALPGITPDAHSG
jgi:pimeloyl-ACP methyl ester carboxylesterase